MLLRPRYAGSFYEADKKKLRSQIKECFFSKYGPKKFDLKLDAKAILVPHAGYSFSGPCAAWAYASLGKIKKAIIFGTNHKGAGAKELISTKAEAILTPLGKIKIDRKILNIFSDFIEFSDSLLAHEHSVEVQLPFLKYLKDEIRVVPLILNTWDKDKLIWIGERLKEIRDIKIIFTSDFTHYGIMYGFMPFEASGKKLKDKIHLLDKSCIEKIIGLDYEGFEREAKKTTICGTNSIGLSIIFAQLKKLKPILLTYYTSSDISLDLNYSSSAIVSYASFAFI